jgi:hypothetical protein
MSRGVKWSDSRIGRKVSKKSAYIQSSGCSKSVSVNTIRRSNDQTFRRSESGQITILSLLVLLIFVLIAAALVDVYMLFEARNWGYQVAQQAALAGVSIGRDWSGVTVSNGDCDGPAPVLLKATVAQNVAVQYVDEAAQYRKLDTYTFDVRVIEDVEGGTMSGYPPRSIRLGSGLGNWSSEEPAVGVYFSFPVFTFLLSLVGRPTVPVHAFASAAVAQPENVCVP